ncbi:MAG TPA: phosphatase PAP2 family protein [Dongiaceae bacterium]|nr:phosphatase PAP2 family protein [Dongiaceae bacterium]
MSLSAVSPSAPGARGLDGLRASLRENSPLILFVLLYGLAPIVVYGKVDIPVAPYHDILMSYVGFFAVAGVSLFAAFALWYLYNSRVRKVKNFPAVAWQRIRHDFLRRDRLMLALPVLALWPITASGFTYLKSVIPLVHPFYLDPMLAEWDRTIHFGLDPWRYLQPLLGYAPVTYLIGFGYTLWFLILQAVLVLQAGASGNRKRRLQFLLSMGLAWAVIGSLIATMMSSVGPCYFGLAYPGGIDPFADQVTYLRGVAASVAETIRLPFTTTVLQDMLWQSYSTNDFGMVRGISAAPSMHIASTWIIARLAWDMGKAARIAGCAFLGFIFIGSIHLGWHYAIDGYMAVALAWTLWRLVGWLLDRPAVQAFLWPADADEAR